MSLLLKLAFSPTVFGVQLNKSHHTEQVSHLCLALKQDLGTGAMSLLLSKWLFSDCIWFSIDQVGSHHHSEQVSLEDTISLVTFC